MDDDTLTPPSPPAKAGWRKQLAANAAVVPVLLWVALRWNLKDEREAPGVVWPAALTPAPDPEALIQTVLTWGAVFLVTVLVLRLAWWRWAKPGTRSRQVALWGLLALWVAAWLGGAWSAWREQANQRGLQATRSETLKLVAVQPVDASSRSVGGARLFVEWPDQGGLYRVVVEGPSPALLAQPAQVTLQLAPGHREGWFVTGWSVPETSGKPAQEGS